MKKIEKEILRWIKKAVKKHPHIAVMLSYHARAYYVNVYPADYIDENDEYATLENEFAYRVHKKYPEEIVLFTTADELFEPQENAKIFVGAKYYEQYTTIEISQTEINTRPLILDTQEDAIAISGEEFTFCYNV